MKGCSKFQTPTFRQLALWSSDQQPGDPAQENAEGDAGPLANGQNLEMPTRVCRFFEGFWVLLKENQEDNHNFGGSVKKRDTPTKCHSHLPLVCVQGFNLLYCQVLTEIGLPSNLPEGRFKRNKVFQTPPARWNVFGSEGIWQRSVDPGNLQIHNLILEPS